jgi:formylglycine-generating enzyme
MANVSKKNISKPQKGSGIKKRSRFFPVILAGFVCAIIAVSGGYGAWYFFSVKANGQENRQNIISKLTGVFSSKQPNTIEPDPIIVEKQSEIVVQPTVIPTMTVTPEPTPDIVEKEKKEETSAPEPTITDIDGVVFVKGGEVTVGGGKTDKPVQRIIIKDFYIAETEVTNSQYGEFIADTKRKPPQGWEKNTFAKGMEDFPVTNVSFADADAFCKWLSKKRGVEVRLPNEVEWERAAKGEEDFIYPWGNDWDKNALTNKGNIGKVKSFEKNKSPFGAYDMVGNVWEITADVELNSNKKPVFSNGQLVRIVRGGSAKDTSKVLVTTRWDTVRDSELKNDLIGFRYIVVK